MAESVREVLIGRIVTALDGASKPAGLNVHRFRTRPVTEDQLPAQVVALDKEAVSTDDLDNIVERRLTVHVQTRIVVPGGTPPDQALDPYLSWPVQALKADETLGGLSTEVVELDTEWDALEQDQVYAAATQRFEIKYDTTGEDPEQ